MSSFLNEMISEEIHATMDHNPYADPNENYNKPSDKIIQLRQWQWQWQWQWKIFIAKITQTEASIIQDHDNIINNNVGKQAQWYHIFGKGDRSKYLCAPSSCIQYDSHMWWAGKQGAGCKEEWIQFRKLQKYIWKHSYEDDKRNQWIW